MPERTNVNIRRLARRYAAQPAMLDVLQNNEMHASLYGQHTDELAGLRASRVNIRSAAEAALSQIRQGRRLDLAATASAANERGVLGSSTDVAARSDVRQSAASAMQGARADRSQQLLQNWTQVLQSRRNYEMGTIGLQQQMAASRAAGNAQSVAEDLIESINNDHEYNGRSGGGDGRGNGGDVPENVQARIASKRENIERLISRIAHSNVPGPTGVYPEEERLRELWRQRNLLRKSAGLDPIAMARLRKLIREAAATDVNQGGTGVSS